MDDKSKIFLNRPVSTKGSAPDGAHKETISSAAIESRPNKFKPGKMREVLIVSYDVQLQGKTVNLYQYLSVTWSEDKPMFRLLSALDCLPDEGEGLNLNDLVGKTVTVTVENVDKGENTYSNVISVKSRQVTSGNKTANNERNRRRSALEEDFSDLFEDTDEED